MPNRGRSVAKIRTPFECPHGITQFDTPGTRAAADLNNLLTPAAGADDQGAVVVVGAAVAAADEVPLAVCTEEVTEWRIWLLE